MLRYILTVLNVEEALRGQSHSLVTAPGGERETDWQSIRPEVVWV